MTSQTLQAFKHHIGVIDSLIKALRLPKKRLFKILFAYYFLTIVSSALEGVGLVLLISVFTGNANPELDALGIPFLVDLINGIQLKGSIQGSLTFLSFVFLVTFLLRFAILAIDGSMGAVIRQKLQEGVFKSYIVGDWSHMRNFSVGDAVGTNTQEALVVSKYLASAISTTYFVIGASIAGILALMLSFQMTFILALTALPAMVIALRASKTSATLSRKSALLRNRFSRDITDRFNGLLQVHVDDNYGYHLRKGLTSQAELRTVETRIGFCSALIGSFNLVLPLSLVILLLIWSKFSANDIMQDFSLIAGIGALGLRAATQLNNVVSQLGNISRLSGSIDPVIKALNVPPAPFRPEISEHVTAVTFRNVTYSFETNRVLQSVVLSVVRGIPLMLNGPSGKGKTTIANLIAGLYFPQDGEIIYSGLSGKEYSSAERRARIGFVTQDIYLFQGTLRSNLILDRPRSDSEIWSVLEQVDAADFVREAGGLNVESAEAGRSLSGGQKRRLGIARVLLSESDILIFDEVTAGLDQKNRSAVVNVISRLSRDYVVVIISHDEIELSPCSFYNL